MKRFTETAKWQDEWFMSLSKDMKFVWLYICDTCDHAGVYEKNIRLLNFVLDTNLTDGEILDTFKGRIVPVGSKWFIPKFIEFQYGSDLNPQSRVHQSVLKRLDTLSIVYAKGTSTLKDKDKDKNKDKDKDKSGRIPTISEWTEHCQLLDSKWLIPDIEKAWNYYDSNGWMRGKTKIAKWKSCAATCYRNWKERQPKTETMNDKEYSEWLLEQ